MRLIDTVGVSLILSSLERSMHVELDSLLQGLGITLSQYSTLSALEQDGELTNAELARACSVTPQTMIRITADLQRLGLVLNAKANSTEKKRKLKLSQKAITVLCRAHSEVNALELKMLGGLQKREQREFLKNLEKCMKALAS